jgi:2-C-methyl-D-erythritol 4-phosphate cytidylyltransferase
VIAIALLLAAGTGERLGAGVPKALVPLGGRPLIAWSLAALARAETVQRVIVVGDRKALAPALPAGTMQVEGGPTRQASCALGLLAVPPESDVVLVHDAARPFAEPALFDAVARAAHAHGAALAAEPLADTLKQVVEGRVVATIERAGLWRAQTPQAARRALLVEAHARARADGVLATDDVALVERLGHAVHVVPASALNRKITTADDLAWAEAWLRARAEDAPR